MSLKMVQVIASGMPTRPANKSLTARLTRNELVTVLRERLRINITMTITFKMTMKHASTTGNVSNSKLNSSMSTSSPESSPLPNEPSSAVKSCSPINFVLFPMSTTSVDVKKERLTDTQFAAS